MEVHTPIAILCSQNVKIRLQVFMAVTVHIAVFWFVTTHSSVLASCVIEEHAASNFRVKVSRLRMQGK
jgi:hypothetical protein